MNLLYKYCPAKKYAIENLEAKKICFSDYKSFNDPFEGVGRFLYEIAPEDKAFWDVVNPRMKQNMEERFSDEVYENNRFHKRVLCLTEKFDNPPMWAHYADNHTGFCVGYSKDDIEKCCSRLEKLTYQSAPVGIDINNMKADDIDHLLFVKSSEWQYEEEWRGIYKLTRDDVTFSQKWEDVDKYYDLGETDGKLRILRGREQLKNYGVLTAEKYKLVSCQPQVVYMGLKLKGPERQKIINICRAEDVELRQMIQCKNSFALQAVKY